MVGKASKTRKFDEFFKPNKTVTEALYRTQSIESSTQGKTTSDTRNIHVVALVITYLGSPTPTATCSDGWYMVCLSSTTHHIKIPEIGSIGG